MQCCCITGITGTTEQEGSRPRDNIKKNSIKTLGGKRSPRESLWVEKLRSNDKNVLQDGTTLTAVARKH